MERRSLILGFGRAPAHRAFWIQGTLPLSRVAGIATAFEVWGESRV